jgi:hypothetical protein
VKRTFAILSSLQLAVVLLGLFAACLAGATLLESRYSARVAQELVYHTWWFALLLALLAVNVLCAALKKYPWRRHQTGFLVTHAGLLVLLSGGLLTALFGVEGQMILIDTPDAARQRQVGVTDRSHTIYLDDQHRLEVYRLRRPASPDDARLLRMIRAADRGVAFARDFPEFVDREWTFRFNPGPFAWYSDEHCRLDLPAALRLLYFLADPAPGFARDLDGPVLVVQNHYPHTEEDAQGRIVPRNLRPGAGTSERFLPALRCSLTSGGHAEDFWVRQASGAARVRAGRDLYLVRYLPDSREVDFTLTLKRARQVKDPGSDRPAWFQSDVTLTPGAGGPASDHSIYMNHTLGHGLYRVYQASYRALVDPQTQQPLLDGERQVGLSGLAVAHDPGLWLKYAGSITVVLGIATMFYMKAYFFKPRPVR